MQTSAMPASRERPSALSLALIALHAAALVLFVFQPKLGAVVLGLVFAVLAGIARPNYVAFFALGFLWANDVISDWMPFSRLTAWKDGLLLIVFLIAAAIAAVHRREFIPRFRVTTPLVLVMLLFLLMSAYSPSPIQALLGLKNTIFYVLWFFALPQIVRTKRDVRSLLIALFFSMAVIGLYNLWRVQLPFGAFPTRRDGRILDGWTQVHWSGSPYLIAPGLLLGLAVQRHFVGWRRLLLMLALVAGTAGLLSAGARATTASVLIGLMLIGLLSGRVGQTLKFLAIGLIAALVLEAAFPIKITQRASSAFEKEDVSRSAREEETSSVTLPYVLSHPFGSGTGVMSALYSSGGVWSKGEMQFALQGGMIHNTFLMIAIEIGWLGAILWAWFLAAAAAQCYRMFRAARDPFVKDVSLGLLAVVLQYSMMHFFAPVLSAALISYAIWFLLGLIVILPRLDAAGGTEGDNMAPALTRGTSAAPAT